MTMTHKTTFTMVDKDDNDLAIDLIFEFPKDKGGYVLELIREITVHPAEWMVQIGASLLGTLREHEDPSIPEFFNFDDAPETGRALRAIADLLEGGR